MSYRSFKRLFGETSLERKCRLFLGGGIFLLILVSFLIYWYQTQMLVWEGTRMTARLMVNPILLQRHFKAFVSKQNEEFVKGFPSAQEVEEMLPEDDKQYVARFLRPGSDRIEHKHHSQWEKNALDRLLSSNDSEISQVNPKLPEFQYVAPIRLRPSCMSMNCHPTKLDHQIALDGRKEGEPIKEFKEGDMIAALSLGFSLERHRMALDVNGAILVSFAIGTAILAMIFAYVTVRYVIVKPVAHLKRVSEEIASGNLDIRANIQTGDEFQELSLAFNRMLRSLVSMQEELRRVNTDLDHRLDELAQANMALFEMNRLKSDFLATISHELRTPLNSILGFSDVLAEAENNLQPKQQRWIQNIQSSGKLLLNMINDILDLAKLEAGKMQLHLEEFSLREIVEGQINMTRPLADKKNIALEFTVDPAIPILRQDPNKLQQVLSNLLSNAIKFTPEGGRILIECRPDRAEVVISVIDNGVGIAPEDQKLVFEKFRQAESSLTRNHGGTGLGLSIVRELTKLLGGDDVQLESELGRGSRFTIHIPMHLEDRQSMDLTLGEESVEFSAARQNEFRFYVSRDRPVGADLGSS